MEHEHRISPRLTLRLPQADIEKLRLAAKTEGLSLSEVVRQLIEANSDGLHKKIRRKAVRSALDAVVVRDLARAGNNLNRIAVALVQIGRSKRVPNMPLVVAELTAIRTLLTDILDRLK